MSIDSATPRADFALDDKYGVVDGEILLTGVQALVRVLFDQIRADRRAGLREAAFVSGYQGSPLGGFDLTLQRCGRFLGDLDIHFVPGVNEDLAATAVWGSQQDHLAPLARHDGVIGMWYGKSPGVDRSGDVFRHANLHGIGQNGGVVCAVGDDPQSKSSTLPSSSEFALFDAGMPVLFPGSIQEVLDLGRHAYELSRFSGCWVGLKIVTGVADGLGTASVHADRISIHKPELIFDGVPWTFRQRPRFFIPDTMEMEKELYERRHEAARAYARSNPVDAIEVDVVDPRLTIVSAGRTFYELREALSALGLADDTEVSTAGIRLVRLGMIFPIEPSLLRRAARNCDELLVVEEKRPFIESQIRDLFYNEAVRPRIIGKRDEHDQLLIPVDGELTADRLRPIIGQILSTRLDEPPSVRQHLHPIRVGSAPPTRRAAFCSGCPHNRSTHDVSGSPVGGGVGCHAMVMWLDRGAVSYNQMGGEGAHWIGRAAFTDTPHFVQDLGDGTYFHSGSLAVRAAVSAGVTMTYKILYNGVVAMTGGQDPAGQLDIPKMCDGLTAEGVTKIAVVSDDPARFRGVQWPATTQVYPREELESVERLLATVSGVTILVYDQACAAELRRLRKRGRANERTMRVVINEAVCEGCGDCGVKSNCLSVHPVDTELGRKTQIHQSSCNTDYSCLDGDCPSFVTLDASRVRRRRNIPMPDLPNIEEPKLPLIGTQGYGIVLAGVGGTGVVTVNQVLATAAFLEGVDVAGLDQTGLAQKGGPVVSHLRLWPSGARGSNAVGEGCADTLLALDLLVAADAKNLERGDPERTTSIVSTSPTPTIDMVNNPDATSTDTARLLPRDIADRTLPDRLVALDTLALAQALFGNSEAANMIALGCAYQAGAIPLRSGSIERAIDINGVATERNRTAFLAGRVAFAQPDVLPTSKRPGAIARRERPRLSAIAGRLSAARGLDHEVAARRARDLVDYQGSALAERYLDVVAKTVQAASRAGCEPHELVDAVVDGYFHLLAYKDEYEVARLHLLPEFDEVLRVTVPGGRHLRYRLHPPFLRALGMKRKLALPASIARPMFRLLRAMRRLRGSPFDPFGYTTVRRAERRLTREFESTMDDVLPRLSPSNYADVVELARLTRQVRGYEHIKLESIARYDKERALTLARLGD